MKNKNVLIITVILAILIFAIAGIAYTMLTNKNKQQGSSSLTNLTSQSSSETSSQEPIDAPDFTLTSMDGREVSLSDYKGKAGVVINFWASWCGPCQSEMPDFNKVEKEMNEDGIVFLMVNLTDGQRETKDTAKKYIEKSNYTFKNILYDEETEVAAMYGAFNIPSTLFINSAGEAVRGYVGPIDEAILRSEIDKIRVKK